MSSNLNVDTTMLRTDLNSDVFNNSDSLNRFNNIIQSLPLKTRITISSLCLLDNISTQLLRFLIFNSNAPHLLAIFTDDSNFLASGETETFQVLLQLFKQVRIIYNARSPLLNVHDVAPGLWFPNAPPPMLLRGHEAYIITVIRKANLLTFILTTLYCFNYGFDLLQNTFLDIFCPNTLFTGTSTSDQNGKFLKSQAILYLDLKTQALIAGLKEFEDENGSIPKDKLESLLDEIFPTDLADQLIERRLGNGTTATNATMTPSERDFVERCDRRRENLLQFHNLNELISSYDWNHFIKELLDYCNKNMGLIIWGRKGRGKSPLYCFDAKEFDQQIMTASGAVSSHYNDNNQYDPLNRTNNESTNLTTVNDTNRSTTTMNGNVSNERGSSQGSPDLLTSNSTGINSTEKSTTTDVNAANSRMTQYIVNAAVAASGQRIKKIKAKRTWSKHEEDALIAGLKEVGSSWSKILDMYGPGGKISEDLKNRTQVQLKDKARNWKLQYLKSGKPLPPYLMKVTGTLDKHTRGKKKNAALAAAQAAAAAQVDSAAQAATAAAAAAAATATATTDNTPPTAGTTANTTTSANNSNNPTSPSSSANDAVNSTLSADHTPSVTTDAASTQQNNDENETSRQNTESQEPNGDLFGSNNAETPGFDPNLETSM